MICIVTKLKKTVNRMEEEENMMDSRLEEVQRKGENMMGRKTSMVGQISEWKEMEEQLWAAGG